MYKEPDVKHNDVQTQSTKDALDCDVLIAGPPCVAFSSLGQRQGIAVAKGKLIHYSLQYIVDKLPPVAIIEKERGLTHKRNAGLLQHVKYC